jgi:hypothetical protein
VQINFLVENPEAHVLALKADGFKEERAKKRISSWPTRCFVKIHNGGLLTETQHIDMSRAPVNLGSEKHEAPVVIDLAFDRRALKKLIETVKKFHAQNPGRPGALNAFLSEYRGVLELLKRVGADASKDPKFQSAHELLEMTSRSDS